jgi:hypothetical protein
VDGGSLAGLGGGEGSEIAADDTADHDATDAIALG